MATTPTAIAPPIRSSLLDPQQPPDRLTASRDWYLFFQNLASGLGVGLLQTNASTHPDRLAQPPERFPDGALWFETDRTVLYAMWNGRWTYLAGTMFGTLSPDERPTDLGPADSGFEFRSTDTPARQFLWSGGEWVEVTPAHYGTHAARLALAMVNVADGELYVETDRGGAIYQNRGGTWHFLAGMMWGTMSPDQRPTDLGANDTGFNYTGTDLRQAFIWSGSAWINKQTPWAQNVDGGAHTLVNVAQLGVGTSAPLFTEHVHAGTNENLGIGPAVSVTGAVALSAFNDANTANTPLEIRTTATVFPIGSVGVGTVNPVFPLQVRAGTNENLGIGPANAVTGAVSLSAVNDANTANTPLEIRTSATFFPVGSVVIGNIAPSYSLQLAADSAAKPGTNTWSVASDGRLKRNVEPFTEGLETVLKLRPVRYEYNGEAETPEGMRAVGLIAQEARAVYPECVRTAPGKIAGEDTDVLFTNTNDLAWMMVNAFRELSERLKQLEEAMARP